MLIPQVRGLEKKAENRFQMVTCSIHLIEKARHHDLPLADSGLDDVLTSSFRWLLGKSSEAKIVQNLFPAPKILVG